MFSKNQMKGYISLRPEILKGQQSATSDRKLGLMYLESHYILGECTPVLQCHDRDRHETENSLGL